MGKNKSESMTHEDIVQIVYGALQKYGADKIVGVVTLSANINGIDFNMYVDCFINDTDTRSLIMPEFVEGYVDREKLSITTMSLGDFYDYTLKHKNYFVVR